MNTQIVKSSYTEKQWEEARELIVSKPEVPLKEISRVVHIPLSILESRAVKQGWMTKRDMEGSKKNVEDLNRIIGEVALQINDLHQHVSALMESLQYSHKIKIERDTEGNVHYKNFGDFPDRPTQKEWDEMDDEKKEAVLRYISPSRLARFMSDLMMVLNIKNSNLNFISKMTKGGLPKVDPSILDLSRRDFDNQIIERPVKDEKVESKEVNKNDDSSGIQK